MLWNIQLWMPDLEELNDYREADGLEELKINVAVKEVQSGLDVRSESFESQGTVPFTASQDGNSQAPC